MENPKLIRITTVPISLEKLLEGQLSYMKQFFDVTAVSSGKKRLKAFGEQEGVSTFYLPLTRKITIFKDLSAVWKLYIYLKREKPQIVHSHTPKAGIVGMLAAYLAKVPFRLHTVAGLPLMETKGLKRLVLNTVEKWTYRFSTGVYPNSKGLYDFILVNKFISKNKLKIIGKGSSNGIDTNYFSRVHYSDKELMNKKVELGISDSDVVFIFVGRIVRDKGINETVAAFTGLQKKYPNISLLLVGPFESDLDPIFDNTKHEISVNPKIYWVGYQDDVRIFLAISDVFVFASYREGFPNVVMQAGAMDLPAIVSDINGCNEIIHQCENGLIVPLKNETALFDAMERLLTDKELYGTLQQRSRALILSRYDRHDMWQSILNEYRKLQFNL